MKKATSVFLAVLLGAIAVAIGTVPYLALANRDRDSLSNQLESASMHVSRVEEEKAKILEEANKKVEDANAEVAHAQAVLTEAQKDQELLATAPHLSLPAPQLLSKWNTIVSLPLGLTLRTPPGSQVITDSASMLSIGKSASGTDPLYPDEINNNPWFIASPFYAPKYDQYALRFSTSTPASYIIGEYLLKGIQGTLLDGTHAAVFNVREHATSTHLLWIQETHAIQFPGGIERVLSTMRFDK